MRSVRSRRSRGRCHDLVLCCSLSVSRATARLSFRLIGGYFGIHKSIYGSTVQLRRGFHSVSWLVTLSWSPIGLKSVSRCLSNPSRMAESGSHDEMMSTWVPHGNAKLPTGARKGSACPPTTLSRKLPSSPLVYPESQPIYPWTRALHAPAASASSPTPR